MSPVILVRHAMPVVEPGVAASLWGLGEAAREDTVLLTHALPRGIAGIWSSDERKARETADVIGLRIGLPVQVDARLSEVDRPQVWDRDYRDVAAGYLGGRAEPGWESRERVVHRFGAAVDEASRGAPGDVVVVNHGLAMTLWLSSVVEMDVVPWWRALTFPDAWRVDSRAGTLERVWMGGTRGE